LVVAAAAAACSLAVGHAVVDEHCLAYRLCSGGAVQQHARHVPREEAPMPVALLAAHAAPVAQRSEHMAHTRTAALRYAALQSASGLSSGVRAAQSSTRRQVQSSWRPLCLASRVRGCLPLVQQQTCSWAPCISVPNQLYMRTATAPPHPSCFVSNQSWILQQQQHHPLPHQALFPALLLLHQSLPACT
jgi:hypothetical protein